MLVWIGLISCSEINALIVDNYPLEYSVPEAVVSHSTLKLLPVISGLTEITDIQFFPSSNTKALIAQKSGVISVLTIGDSSSVQAIANIPVKTNSEQGALGLAFHPNFTENRLVYAHITPLTGESRTEISEWYFDEVQSQLTKKRVLFEVDQPYSNHNGGQIQFGKDGYLYIALGDGGWRDDPHDNGQKQSTLLGSIIRLDVTGDPYTIPKDNPFIGQKGSHPLIWAYGLRNPWRFSFLQDERIITGDVGQGKYEEVSVISKGDNLGWNLKEGKHCFEERQCDSQGLVDPIYEYEHSQGASITGGYVVLDGSSAEGKYVFGDFTSGRIWLLDPLQNPSEAQELIQSGLNISTFGRSANGTVYLGDYIRGGIYRLQFL